MRCSWHVSGEMFRLREWVILSLQSYREFLMRKIGVEYWMVLYVWRETVDAVFVREIGR